MVVSSLISPDPAETWHACINFIALVDGEVLEPKHTSAATDDSSWKSINQLP